MSIALTHLEDDRPASNSAREGSRDTVVVRVLAAPPDYALVRYVAVLGLVVALVFLWLLLR